MFTENSIYSPTDTFFSGTDSDIGFEINAFSKSTQNKIRIKKIFSVENTVAMLSNTSSFMYFSNKSKQWMLPSQSSDLFTGPFEDSAFSFPSYFGPSNAGETVGSKFAEDYKGFDPYGNVVVRGNVISRSQSTGSYEYTHTIEPIKYTFLHTEDATNNAVISDDLFVEYFQQIMTYPSQRSIWKEERYHPEDAACFTLLEPDSAPFLIEKVICEIPFAMGQSWFDDRTVTCYGDWINGRYRDNTISSYADQTLSEPAFFDSGGPTITVSLFCKKNYGTSSIVELIASGTITHVSDSYQTLDMRLVFSESIPFDEATGDSRIMITPVGNSMASTVVHSNSTHTGSIQVKMTPAITNGISCIQSRFIEMSTLDNDAASAYAASLFTNNSDNFSPETANKLDYFIYTCKPFGRSALGNSIAGSSIFGREFITKDLTTRESDLFYFGGHSTDEISDLTNKFDNLVTTFQTDRAWPTPPNLRRICRLPKFAHANSPYLAFANDKFFIAVAKTRSAISGASFEITTVNSKSIGEGSTYYESYFTGSGAHDVQLITGTINLTVFGSYVKGGNSL